MPFSSGALSSKYCVLRILCVRDPYFLFFADHADMGMLAQCSVPRPIWRFGRGRRKRRGRVLIPWRPESWIFTLTRSIRIAYSPVTSNPCMAVARGP